MSRVTEAITHHWEPGRHATWLKIRADAPPGADPRYWSEEDTQARQKWENWERRNHFAVKVLLLTLASNAAVTSQDKALTFMKVATIASAIERGHRATQYFLRRLEEAHEIEHTPCDGLCDKYHGDTDHWIIPRPLEAPAWDDRRYPVRRRGRPRAKGGGA